MLVLGGLLLGGGGDAARAQAPQVRAHRVSTAPAIDGRLDEAAWARADSATGFRQIQPTPGAPASRRTVARVLYDDEHLYVGARMYDHPDSIAAQVLGRDGFGYTDRFVVSVGSYNNDRNAFRFRVGPSGSRVDGVLSDDDDADTSWDGVWTAETRIDARGWTAEIRIPLSQLRYSPVPADTTAAWGINFRRDIARRREQVSWPPLDPTVDRVVSLYGSLRNLRALPATRSLEVEPYLAGLAERAAAPGPLRSPTEWGGRVGGDLRYGLTPSVSLRATINPDFGQVEADPSQINLSAFETFLPEKRPFFVEGADIFDVQRGPRLFYSRRIGRAPQGAVPDSADEHAMPEQTTILGAAKLTGRTAGDWEVGVLEAVTAQETATILGPSGRRATPVVEPTTNYAVARVRKNLQGGRSTVGGVVTATHRPGLEARLADDMHRAAYAGGVDGRHRFGAGTYEVRGSLLGSQVRGSRAALLATQTGSAHYFQRPDAGHVAVDSSRTRLHGWRASGAVEKISGRWRWAAAGGATAPGFEINDLGFLRQSDDVSINGRLTYLKAEEGRRFQELYGRLAVDHEWTFGGLPTRRSLFYLGDVEFRNNASYNLGGRTTLPAYSVSALRGGPALRENARTTVFTNYASDGRDALRVGASTNYTWVMGTDGYEYNARVELRYRPSAQAEVSVEPRLSLERDPAQYVETVSAGRRDTYVFGALRQRTLSVTTRASYAFTPEMTLALYAQPFLSSGDYGAFAEVADPDARAFADRFASVGERIAYDAAAGTCRVRGDGGAGYTFSDPDFTFQQLRSTVVFQWQYRRGSTVYLVWNRGRTRTRDRAVFDPLGDAGALVRGGSNTLAVKVDFWLDG
jgi:hypothetical protein